MKSCWPEEIPKKILFRLAFSLVRVYFLVYKDVHQAFFLLTSTKEFS